MSSNEEAMKALMVFAIIALLLVVASVFGLVRGVADWLDAEMAPVGRALGATVIVLIVAGLAHFFFGRDRGWGHSGLPIEVTVFGAATVDSFFWLRVLDSMALCRVNGCDPRPTFWQWALGRVEPIGRTSPFDGFRFEHATPDVWYTSVLFQVAVVLVPAAVTVWLWLSARNEY